jgi:hypothetical protein
MFKVVGSADLAPVAAGASVAALVAAGASVAADGGLVAAAGGWVAGAAPPHAASTMLARTRRLIKANSLRMFFSSQKNEGLIDTYNVVSNLIYRGRKTTSFQFG